MDDIFYKNFIKNLLKTSKLGYGFVVRGAESGENFEHIYDNRPQGSFVIGRYVDRALLNLTAVKSTRQRKEDIKEVLWNEIYNNKFRKNKTKVLDLASGGARYIREFMQEHRDGLVESVCIDRDRLCVQMGRSLSEKEGLENIRFIRGNVFRLNHLNRLSSQLFWKPNVVIASGFFLYFNNDAVEKMIREIYQFINDNDMLIFSSYEHLTTKKLMRKAMSTSDGKEWILYYRKPEYWRNLLHLTGFKEIYIKRDQWKMNNICWARK